MLKDLSNDELQKLYGYRANDLRRREARAKESNLRSDRALADEAFTSLFLVQQELKQRGVTPPCQA